MTLLGPDQIATQFGAAAEHYEKHAVLQREIGTRLLDSLEDARRPPSRILDLGGGTGYLAAELKRRFPKALVVVGDLALEMLRASSRNDAIFRPLRAAGVDAVALPFHNGSLDLIVSNCMLQWVNDPQLALAEMSRALHPEGMLLLSTFGPATLQELRASWQAVDSAPHVHDFPDVQTVGNWLQQLGMGEPLVHRDMFDLRYQSVEDLVRDLRGLGATLASTRRRRALTGRRRYAQMRAEYETRRDKTLPATFEAIYVRAYAPHLAPGESGRIEVSSIGRIDR